jgi:hypothetical protein
LHSLDQVLVAIWLYRRRTIYRKDLFPVPNRELANVVAKFKRRGIRETSFATSSRASTPIILSPVSN